MPERLPSWCLLSALVALLFAGVAGLTAGDDAAPMPPAAARRSARQESKPRFHTETLQGRVVWLDEALQDDFGIDVDSDAVHTTVALREADGRLHPLVKDARGRAFFKDERLRGVDMELTVRRYEKSPFVQVLRVCTLKPDGKYELDYWCDICAITMYELKDCECCQGPIRLRERLIEKKEKERSDAAKPGR